MHRKEIIQEVLNALGRDTYLEIGVLYGTVFTNIRARRKIAVDPHFQISLKRRIIHGINELRSMYHEMTSDVFFANRAGVLFRDRPITVAFIDGLHTYEQSLRDVMHTLEHLDPDGMILMHDCNPTSPERELPEKSGDVWKTIVHLRSRSDVTAFVVDEDCGLGVVVPNSSEALETGEPGAMTYEDLASDRERLLDLRSYEKFISFLGDYVGKKD